MVGKLGAVSAVLEFRHGLAACAGLDIRKGKPADSRATGVSSSENRLSFEPRTVER